MSGMPYGEFAGRFIFGSTGTEKKHYLTIVQSGQSAPVLEMRASALTRATECIFYKAGESGGVYMQMENCWVRLNKDLGWLILDKDFAKAAIIYLGGSPNGQTLQILNKGKKCSVFYTVEVAPLLTINQAGGESQFDPAMKTPSFSEIRTNGGWPEANFEHVDLTGHNLSGLDFSKANFKHANLQGVKCDQTIFDFADFSHSVLDKTHWGSPKSAKSIVLDQCSARGARLNASRKMIDFTQASCVGADFTDAELRGLDLTKAHLNGALLIRATLDHGLLDKADLSNVIALDASIQNCSLKGIAGQGANFSRANVSASDFGEARLGTKNYLFSLSGTFVDELDSRKYPQQDLVEAFAKSGIDLSPEAPIAIVVTKQHWSIKNGVNVYQLIKNSGNIIQVFLTSANLIPAIFAEAICIGTKAQGASLAGVNLSRCLWYGEGSTLDHADLEGAIISDTFMLETDFTQAFLSGANFNNSVLILAKFGQCVIGSPASQGAASFVNAQLQGCDFSESALQNCILMGAAVSLPQGVPLFSLPLTDKQYLTGASLSNLKQCFTSAGYPLGSSPTIKCVSKWSIDNSADHSNSPKHYWIKLGDDESNLYVFDASTSNYLFSLDAISYAPCLKQPTVSGSLQKAFQRNNRSLADQAPISLLSYWELKPDPDAPWVRSSAYPTLQIFEKKQLNVFGATTVKIRDYLQLYPEIAFSGTQKLETALNPASIGPGGYPRLLVDQERIDWLTYFSTKRVSEDIPPLAINYV